MSKNLNRAAILSAALIAGCGAQQEVAPKTPSASAAKPEVSLCVGKEIAVKASRGKVARCSGIIATCDDIANKAPYNSVNTFERSINEGVHTPSAVDKCSDLKAGPIGKFENCLKEIEICTGTPIVRSRCEQ